MKNQIQIQMQSIYKYKCIKSYHQLILHNIDMVIMIFLSVLLCVLSEKLVYIDIKLIKVLYFIGYCINILNLNRK